MHLLTEAEEIDARTPELRFDIGLLAGRITEAATGSAEQTGPPAGLPLALGRRGGLP